jgi:WD40 repeat protein/serine/threonine protein kinase
MSEESKAPASSPPESVLTASSLDPVLDRLLGQFVRELASGRTVDLEQALPARPDLLAEVQQVFGMAQRLAARPVEQPPHIPGYEILGELGRGGMGTVFLARQERLGRTVALKALSAWQAASPKVRERFEREAQAVARLRHPLIVPILEVGDADGTPFFTMEVLDGRSLAQVLDALRERQVAPEQLTGGDLARAALGALPDAGPPEPWCATYIEAVCRLVLDAADALHHAHEHGIVHRDVKPSNLMVRRDGRALVLDFGLAQVGTEHGLTATGDFVGTPSYVAPEQIAHSHAGIDRRADVYSLGVTLYELLTLAVPFRDETLAQVFRQILTREPPSPRRANPQIPRDLETVCLTALEKRPERRYASAADLAADLRRFLAFRPVTVRPLRAGARGARWMQRNPAIAATIGLGLLLVVGGPAALWLQERATGEVIAREKNDAVQARNAKDLALRNAERDLMVANLVAADAGLQLHEIEMVKKRLFAVPAGQHHFEWRYLMAQTSQSLIALHTDNYRHMHDMFMPTGLACSADGSWLAVSGTDGAVRLWDPSTAALTRVLRDRSAGISAMAITPDARTVVAIHTDGSLCAWNPEDGSLRWSTTWDPGMLQKLALSDDGQCLAASNPEGAIQLFDAGTGTARRSWTGPGRFPTTLVFVPGTRTLVSSHGDCRLRLWNTATGESIGELLNTAPANSLAVDPGGRWLAAGGADGSIRVWELAAKAVLLEFGITARLAQPADPKVAFSPDGSRLVAGGGDGLLRVWDTATWRLLDTKHGHAPGIVALTFTADSRRIVSAGLEHSVMIWSVRPTAPQLMLHGHQKHVSSVAYSPDGKRLASAAADTPPCVRVWDVRSRKQVQQLPCDAVVRSVAYRRDGELLAACCQDGAIKVWDARTGNELRTLMAAGGAVLRLAFSPDGALLATGSARGAVQLWDPASGQSRGTLSGHRGTVVGLAFHPSGEFLATCSDDKSVRIWAVADRRSVKTIATDPSMVYSLQFTRDGAQLLCGDMRRGLTLWDWRNAKEIPAALNQVGASGFCMNLSPDGSRLAVAGFDGYLRLLETDSWQELLCVRHPEAVLAVAFSPDGGNIATACRDTEVRIFGESQSLHQATGLFRERVADLLLREATPADALRALRADTTLGEEEHELAELALGRLVAEAEDQADAILAGPTRASDMVSERQRPNPEHPFIRKTVARLARLQPAGSRGETPAGQSTEQVHRLVPDAASRPASQGPGH